MRCVSFEAREWVSPESCSCTIDCNGNVSNAMSLFLIAWRILSRTADASEPSMTRKAIDAMKRPATTDSNPVSGGVGVAALLKAAYDPEASKIWFSAPRAPRRTRTCARTRGRVKRTRRPTDECHGCNSYLFIPTVTTELYLQQLKGSLLRRRSDSGTDGLRAFLRRAHEIRAFRYWTTCSIQLCLPSLTAAQPAAARGHGGCCDESSVFGTRRRY